MPCFVIVNPSAGRGRTGRLWPSIADRLTKQIGTFDHAFTRKPGEATDMARRAIDQGACLVVAVGGDGTVNEAVNGFATRDGTVSQSCAFAALAAGTGADFVRSLSTGESLLNPDTRQIDLGRITFGVDNGQTVSRLFINIASFGLSGEVDRAVAAARTTRFLPGKAAYYLATVSALARYRFTDVRLTVDDQPPFTVSLAMAAIANGRYFGGGMLVAPNARLDSGAFEIVILRGGSRLTMVKDLSRVYRGAHMNHPMVTALRGRKIVAEPVDPHDIVPLDIDGESPGCLKAEFEILPSALTLRQ